jgi:transcriptional regulator with XRE-family HTH domain
MARRVEPITMLGGGRGVTQNARRVAEAIGIDHVAVWRWLVGYSRPSRMALARLVQAGIVLDLPPRRPRPKAKRKRRGGPARP